MNYGFQDAVPNCEIWMDESNKFYMKKQVKFKSNNNVVAKFI